MHAARASGPGPQPTAARNTAPRRHGPAASAPTAQQRGPGTRPARPPGQGAGARDPGPVFRSLADPTRRALYERILAAGELPAGALTGGAGISQPAVSQHLRALREAGLVAERRAGRHILYRPAPGGLAPLASWLDHHAAFWRDRLAALETLLKELDT